MWNDCTNTSSTSRGSLSLKRPRDDSGGLTSWKRASANDESNDQLQLQRQQEGNLLLSSSSSLQNEAGIYRPQNQLVGTHRDRMDAYDRRRQDPGKQMGSETNTTSVHPRSTASLLVHGSRNSKNNYDSTTYKPLSYVPSTYETIQAQHQSDTKTPLPPLPPKLTTIMTSATAATTAPGKVNVGGGRTVASGSPRNPYLKSATATDPSPTSNPYKKPVAANSVSSSSRHSKPSSQAVLPLLLSSSSPRNPYARQQQQVQEQQQPVAKDSTTRKPACARSILPPSPSNNSVNPYLTRKKPGMTATAVGNSSTSEQSTTTVMSASNKPPVLLDLANSSSGPLAQKKLFTANPYQKRSFPNAASSSNEPQRLPAVVSQKTTPGNLASSMSKRDNKEVVVLAPPSNQQQAVSSISSSMDPDVIVIDDPPPNPTSSVSSTIQPSAKMPAAPQIPKPGGITSSCTFGVRNYPSTVASMRPESWTLTKSSSPTTATTLSNPTTSLGVIASNRPELPGEVHLPPELVYDPSSINKPIKDEYRSKLTINAKLDQPLLNGWTLYRHQKRAILKGLMKRRVILALDMGLGKTLIGCVWSKAFKESYEDLKILVVCPVTLKKEWKRTAENATGLVVEEENSKAPKKGSLDLGIYSWAKIPTTVDPAVKHFVAVFDEAHAMQTMDSIRTKAALKLVKDKRCVGVLLLTGTPMKNGKPCNLFPLLRAVGHPLGKHQQAYERHFCQGRVVNIGGRGQQWLANGQANLKQLHRMIESNLLHMTKDEYLKDLPPLKRETRVVPVSARCEKSYHEAVRRLANFKEAMKTNQDLNTNALLGMTQDLRVICAFAKIRATVELAKEILQHEPAVVIFTNFAKAAQSIHKQLADAEWQGALLTGETAPNKRQELVDGFQNEIYPVFVSTFGAGGVGITLTQARTVIFLDRPWTPGELLQAEDRIRRIGQQHNTRSIWMSAFEFDKQLDFMLEEKNQAAKVVLTKSGTMNGAASSTSIDIPKLVACLISKSAMTQN